MNHNIHPVKDQDRTNRKSLLAGFTLLEMLMAVAITSVITLALYAIFAQTQRAFRAGIAQVDILESGRAASEIIDTDIRQIVPNPLETELGRTAMDQSANFRLYPYNFWIDNFSPFSRVGSLSEGTSVFTFLQNVLFFHRRNDEVSVIGYYNLPLPIAWAGGRKPPQVTPVSTLYRFSWSLNIAELNQVTMQVIMANFLAGPLAWQQNPTNTYQFQEIVRGVVHMRWSPFTAQGIWWQNDRENPMIVRSRGGSSLSGLTAGGSELPAQLEYELMLLEDEVLAQYVILAESNTQQAQAFLAKHLQEIHIFRKRIPTALFQ